MTFLQATTLMGRLRLKCHSHCASTISVYLSATQENISEHKWMRMPLLWEVSWIHGDLLKRVNHFGVSDNISCTWPMEDLTVMDVKVQDAQNERVLLYRIHHWDTPSRRSSQTISEAHMNPNTLVCMNSAMHVRFRRTTVIISTNGHSSHGNIRKHMPLPSAPWPRGGGRTEAYSPRRRQPSVWAQTSLLGGWRLRRASCRRWRSSWGRQRPQRSSCPQESCRQIPQVCTPPLPRRCNWQMPWHGPRSGKREARG